MDRPITNANQGELTDEEFRVLKAADEKMMRGRPIKKGWFCFTPSAWPKHWLPTWVVMFKGELHYLPWGRDPFSEYKPVSDTTDDQWSGEIPMPEDGE